MAEYIEYHPLKFWLDPASIAEIVAHIQTYLVNNPINSTTEIETIIHDYLIAHPELIGGVDSVNGLTGEVVLTADNISGGENITIKDVLNTLQDQIDDIVASIPSDFRDFGKSIGINIHTADVLTNNSIDTAKWDSEKSIINDTGLKIVRTNSAAWSRIETSAGVYDFTFIDTIVNDLIEDGIKVVLTLSNGTQMSFYDNCIYPKTTEQISAFVNYVSAVANHYKNKGLFYMLWNEPQYEWKTGTPTQTDFDSYETAITQAITSIKAIDSTAKIISSSFGYDTKLKYNYLTANVLNLVDYVGINYYPVGIPEDSWIEIVSAINSYCQSKIGRNIPIFVTETGYTTVPDYEGTRQDHPIVTEAERTELLPRSLLTALSLGVEYVLIHDAWNDQTDVHDAEDWYGIYTTLFAHTTTSNAIKSLINSIDNGLYIGRALTPNDDYILVCSFENVTKAIYWTVNDEHIINIDGTNITLNNGVSISVIPNVPKIFEYENKKLPYLYNYRLNSLSFGLNNKANGYRAFVTGQNNTSEGYNNIITGNTNTATGQNAIVNGNNNNASGNNSIATGYGNTVTGNNSFVEGAANTVSGSYSHAAGTNNNANGDRQFVVGKFSKDATDELFTVGYGNGDQDRKTAFAVKSSGNIVIDDSEYTRSEIVGGKLATTFTDISSYNSASNKFTAPSNGVIYMRAADNSLLAIAMGGAGYNFFCSNNNAFPVPIHKGETVYVVASNGTTYVRFIAFQS